MYKRLVISLLLCSLLQSVMAARGPVLPVVSRIYDYAATVDTTTRPTESTYTYRRFLFSVDRRNPFLMLVPTVYVVAHGGDRKYIGENYARADHLPGMVYEETMLLRTTTVPHRRKPFNSLKRYLTPEIYNETIIEDNLLSPFHRANKRWYRYSSAPAGPGQVSVKFKPRRRNTQLVTGEAHVDEATGRIVSCTFTGEFDMVTFWITLDMGDDGFMSLYPQRCEVRTRFRFARSKTTAQFLAYYNLPQVLQDSIKRADDLELMAQVRPTPLDNTSQDIYNKWLVKKQQRDSIAQADTLKPKPKTTSKDILWDVIGDNLVNRIKSNFGINNQGYLRINPILNPLYMGYDHRRGFTYKFDVRASYQLADNSEISTRLKAGYAFKQRQFYYRLPTYLYFNKRKNNYLKFEIGNGNHIRSRSVTEQIRKDQSSPFGMMPIDYESLNEFRRGDGRLVFNWNFNERYGYQVGMIYQCHEAIDKMAFSAMGWRSKYRSFAPIVQLQYRPWGWDGPVFTADYDRSIKGILNSNTGYERIELDGSYIHRIRKVQSVQMRMGAGFYTWKDKQAYFLNYENFQEDNLASGWNDDWSGDFELLRRDTYNYSNYYIRGNISYESPLLLLSRLPWIGHYMEIERIYGSVLYAENLHPYLEIGYGFTNRLFSCGLFVSNGKGNRTIGCKVGFELFRHW